MFCYTRYELVNLANIWSFLTVAGAIGTIIVFQKPIGNIIANVMRAAQTSPSSQQTPYAGPTNNPNPSAPTSTPTTTSPSTPTPSTPSTPSPTVAKGGTDRFGVTHFYPDSPTGVKWYMTGCQIQNGSFEGKVAGGDITNGCMGTDNSKMRWDIWSNPSACNYHNFNANPMFSSNVL